MPMTPKQMVKFLKQNGFAEEQKIAAMFDMLPKQEQDLAAELFKRIVLAWDPDFTKLTAYEEEQLKEAENSGYVDMEEIDWDNLDKY